MKKLKALTLVSLTAFTAVTAPVAKADNFEDHNRLWQTLENKDRLMSSEVVFNKLKKLVEKSDKLRKSLSYKDNLDWKQQKRHDKS